MVRVDRLLLLVALLALLCSVCASAPAEQDDKEDDEYVYKPYVPSFSPKEELNYNVYWRGLKVGHFQFRSGEKPPEDGKYRYYFEAKSNRVGKLIFRFFSTSARSVQNTADGSSEQFFRHLSRDDRFLEERLFYDYKYMQLKQIISKIRGSKPIVRYRLIEGKMADPITALYRLRDEKLDRKGEKRELYLFCDGFFSASLEVTGQKKDEYRDLGNREVWTAKLRLPRPVLSFKTGTFSLEIDKLTGIMLAMRWDDTAGDCKAQLVSTKNSPLEMVGPNEQKALR
ncbi:MAG: DUF3108 domain-containing protein [Planctomycetota bacterium]|nr:DUF3108 domain-containing protein [Planctomycetota bacterium]